MRRFIEGRVPTGVVPLLLAFLLAHVVGACSPSSEPPPGSLVEGPEGLGDTAIVRALPDSVGPSSGSPAGNLVEEREDLGDTVVVRALSGSVWPGPAELVEEVSIGALEGADEEMFGQITEMAPDGAGGVFVFDRQVPALRHYDAEGRFLGNFGREGSGPGEYRDGIDGMALRRDGRLMIRDTRNARLTLYNPDGTPSDHWFFGSGLHTSDALRLDTADHAYLKILTGRPGSNEPRPWAFVHLDDQGRLIDTIPLPEVAVPLGAGVRAGIFSPRTVWGWSPLGYLVVGMNNRYSFDLRIRGGPVLRVERKVAPVRLHDEERSEYEAMSSRVIPAVKPAYTSFHLTRSGQIWVRLHVAAEKRDVVMEEPPVDRPPPLSWIEPLVFDVFQPDGRYLGEVHVPPRTEIRVFDEETLWGIRYGEFGEAYVVRFRLVIPENRGEDQS